MRESGRKVSRISLAKLCFHGAEFTQSWNYLNIGVGFAELGKKELQLFVYLQIKCRPELKR